ncbi:MAG: XdhC family protein [Bacteroidota bacterium]
MFDQLINKMNDLHDKREAFAIASVVLREVPSSGKPGDRAVIEANGKMTGWIGGGCTQGIILKEAKEAIASGKPRLIRIAPEATNLTEVSGKKLYKMTCHSGGSVEVYIDPVLPKPNLIIMGKSHVAMSLAKIAAAMDYHVSAVSRGADKIMFPTANVILDQTELDRELINPYTFIVVCTQGENDELALEQAARSGVPYVSFVASFRKANAVFSYLRDVGVDIDRIRAIKTPAGLDLNAKTPEEVAISILAQIIQTLRDEKVPYGQSAQDADEELNLDEDLFINPVCNIPVKKSSAKHVLEYEGQSYYFCCDGCKVSFENTPEQYAITV